VAICFCDGRQESEVLNAYDRKLLLSQAVEVPKESLYMQLAWICGKHGVRIIALMPVSHSLFYGMICPAFVGLF